MGRKAAGRSAGGGAACFTPRHVPRSCEPACTKRHRHRGEGEEVLHSAALRPARSLPYEGYGPGGGARGAGRAQSREGDDIRRLRCGRHHVHLSADPISHRPGGRRGPLHPQPLRGGLRPESGGPPHFIRPGRVRTASGFDARCRGGSTGRLRTACGVRPPSWSAP